MKQTIFNAAVAATALLSVSAFAQGVYMGASAGSTRYGSTPQLAGGGNAVSKSGAGKGFVGYRFPLGVAVEAGYVRLGRVDSGTAAGETIQADGGFADALLTFAMTPRWALVGRVGAERLKATYSGGAVTDSGESQTSFRYGIGSEYRIVGGLSIRIEAEKRRMKIGGDSVAVDSYLIGTVLRL